MSEPRTVLLVEDNEDNRIVYATMLEHYGYKVVETANGEDAVRIAREELPDLILMDISIPGIDGWTATERIRQDKRTADIPVVAVTATTGILLVSGCARMRSVAVHPSMPGIEMSMRIRSGSSSRAMRTASSPFAVSTTRYP